MSDLEQFIPAVGLALAFSIPIGYLWARLTGIRVSLAVATCASLFVVLALTLSPAGPIAEDGTPGVCSLGLWRTETLEMFGVGEALLNIALFVPLGFVLAFQPAWRGRPFLTAAAIVLPFAIELVQLRVPGLGRYCDTMDIADNLIGLALGFGSGASVVTLWRVLRRALRVRERPADVG